MIYGKDAIVHDHNDRRVLLEKYDSTFLTKMLMKRLIDSTAEVLKKSRKSTADWVILGGGFKDDFDSLDIW